MGFQLPIHEYLADKIAKRQGGKFCVNCGSETSELRLSLVARTHWGIETLVLQCKSCDKVERIGQGTTNFKPVEAQQDRTHTESVGALF